MRPIDYQTRNQRAKFLDYLPGAVSEEYEKERVARHYTFANAHCPRVVVAADGRRFGLYSAQLWRELTPELPTVIIVLAGQHYQVFQAAQKDSMLWPLVVPGAMRLERVEGVLAQAREMDLSAGIGLNPHRKGWEQRIQRLSDAGACFLMTQPVYSVSRALDVCKAVAMADADRKELAYWVGVQRPKVASPGEVLSFGKLPKRFGRFNGRYDEQTLERDYGVLRKDLDGLKIPLYVMQMTNRRYNRYDHHADETDTAGS